MNAPWLEREKPGTFWMQGDVFEQLARIPDGSIDLCFCSPPFLALRSYLPDDHPDKGKEIGAESSPAQFIDKLLDVVETIRPKLASHGSLVFELGDTFAGSGGAGGDYAPTDPSNGTWAMRSGQPMFSGSGRLARYADDRGNPAGMRDTTFSGANTLTGGGAGWPLDKSICLIPQQFAMSLAYGFNVLTGPERDLFVDDYGNLFTEGRSIEQWRVRNLVAWCRPNPPVGALSDKFRPATSYLTIATMARDRWFDMDAVRTDIKEENKVGGHQPRRQTYPRKNGSYGDGDPRFADRVMMSNPGGAPLLDYWEIPTQPYKGAHYATFPEELPRRVVLSMCPERVCTKCGEPSRRIVERDSLGKATVKSRAGTNAPAPMISTDVPDFADRTTIGWTDCKHDSWRPGVVLDPFAGSGTTLRIAHGNGRSAVGIDLDARNFDLARERVGMWLEEWKP